MRWSTFQCDKVWDNIYSQCDEDTQLLLDRRLDFLREKGNLSGRPISAPLKDGIFELRAKIVRMLFYFEIGQMIIFVHGIMKKTGNLPPADIELAKKRRTEIRTKRRKTNALIN
jgi:phage-related protein